MRSLFKIIFFLVFVTLFSSCEKKYRWAPSECAPKHYPAKILTNNFKYKNDGGVGTLQVTAGGNGWGRAGASYVVGERLKPVPDSLFVNWFSVTEGKFYKGRFKLDYEAIEQELKKGQIRIYPCFAPHGRVVIYVSGKHGKVPVQRLRAKEDTSMTVTKYRLNNAQVKSVSQYEKEYAEIFRLDSLYLRDLVSKETREYIKKYGIPDKW